MRREFQLQAGGETLACDVTGAPQATGHAPRLPHIVVLHGAGHGNRERQRPLRDTLAAAGHASVACDFSGHGHSSAHHPNSLAKRLAEAQQLLRQASSAPRTVVGVSMSGEIALRLACQPENQVAHVVTLVGAIYDGAAFSLPFGPDFSAALRRPHSWRDAEVLSLIAHFRGDLTLVRAGDDQVIPAAVAELVQRHARQARSCRIIDLPGVDHRISERCAQDQRLRAQLAALITRAG